MLSAVPNEASVSPPMPRSTSKFRQPYYYIYEQENVDIFLHESASSTDAVLQAQHPFEPSYRETGTHKSSKSGRLVHLDCIQSRLPPRRQGLKTRAASYHGTVVVLLQTWGEQKTFNSSTGYTNPMAAARGPPKRPRSTLILASPGGPALRSRTVWISTTTCRCQEAEDCRRPRAQRHHQRQGEQLLARRRRGGPC